MRDRLCLVSTTMHPGDDHDVFWDAVYSEVALDAAESFSSTEYETATFADAFLEWLTTTEDLHSLIDFVL